MRTRLSEADQVPEYEVFHVILSIPSPSLLTLSSRPANALPLTSMFQPVYSLPTGYYPVGHPG